MAGEFDLIYRYLAHLGAGEGVTLSVGDDAAVLRPSFGCELLVSTDTLVEGRHFPRDTLPEHIAFRAVATAASDLAAMGATPLAMTLALTLPESDELWLHGLATGLGQAVSALQLPLVGGDLTRGPLSLTVTVMGQCPAGKAVRRSGARPGERLCVTGTLGDAAMGLSLIEGRSGLESLPEWAVLDYLEERFHRPTARLDWSLWLRDHASSAIDVSDGLLADVGHLAGASGVSLHIETSTLPLSEALRSLATVDALTLALTGGDDYEVAFTVPRDVPLPLGCTAIGWVADGDGVHHDATISGELGYDHFN